MALAVVPSGAAHAQTTIDVGTAAPFSVLGASTVTNTGPSVLNGDLGLSPGSDVTGFPPGVLNGTEHVDEVATLAQGDLTTAYNVAAGLTPTTTNLTDLAGLSLVPGIYSGGELSLSGDLTLEGTADSVWVFQAASTLITASGSNIQVTGGASPCNVFWQVSDSATLGTGSTFVGTIMANVSVTATTEAQVTGRLLARTGAVTLDTNLITVPDGCPASGATGSPTITSAAPMNGTAGTPYRATITASGSPAPTFAVTGGSLPAGLVFDAATGVISGTPTAAGTYTFTITASNGVIPDATPAYSITITASGGTTPGGTPTPPTPTTGSLAATGARDGSLFLLAIALGGSGLLVVGFSNRRRSAQRR